MQFGTANSTECSSYPTRPLRRNCVCHASAVCNCGSSMVQMSALAAADVPHREECAFAPSMDRHSTLTNSHVQFESALQHGTSRRTPYVQVICFENGYPLVGHCKTLYLLVVRRHLVVNVADKSYPHLCGIIATEDITSEMCLHLHVHLCTLAAQPCQQISMTCHL
jgi:hypothetical protein